MELLGQIADVSLQAVFKGLSFLFVLTVVVFIHELGHFLVARWCGVGVEAFSIGFGKEIWGFNDKHGTRWKLCWIPLGGYVKFIGDENAASVPDTEALEKLTPEERKVNFHAKPLWARSAVVAAGPIANFLLAIFIFACMFTFFGEKVTAPRVDEVQVGSAAQEAGFKAGDVIRKINGQEIDTFSQMQRLVSVSANKSLTFVVERDGAFVDLTATPERREITDKLGNTVKTGLLGIKRKIENDDEIIHRRYDPLTATWMGTEKTVFIITHTLSMVYGMITGSESSDQLGGILRIADMAGEAAKIGFDYLFNLLAVISVSIGLLNLFPIPILDGGHLMFYAFEAVKGRPLSEEKQEIAFRIGFALVLMLMIFATWNDLIHFTKKIL